MTNEKAIEGLKKVKSFHNGSYGEYINIAIKALKAQPQDAVSREAIAKVEPNPDAYTEEWNEDYEKGFLDAIKAIQDLPSVIPQRPKGKWILDNNGWNTICNCCGQGEWHGYIPTPDEATKWMPICPKCGANMEVNYEEK